MKIMYLCILVCFVTEISASDLTEQINTLAKLIKSNDKYGLIQWKISLDLLPKNTRKQLIIREKLLVTVIKEKNLYLLGWMFECRPQYGFAIDRPDKNGNTPFHIAAGITKPNMVGCMICDFIKRSSIIDSEYKIPGTKNEELRKICSKRNYDGKTPLIVALEHDNFPAAGSLLRYTNLENGEYKEIQSFLKDKKSVPGCLEFVKQLEQKL